MKHYTITNEQLLRHCDKQINRDLIKQLFPDFNPGECPTCGRSGRAFPEPRERAIKKKDRVRIVANDSDHSLPIGDIATVIKVDPDDTWWQYYVGSSTTDRLDWVAASDIELVSNDRTI